MFQHRSALPPVRGDEGEVIPSDHQATPPVRYPALLLRGTNRAALAGRPVFRCARVGGGSHARKCPPVHMNNDGHTPPV